MCIGKTNVSKAYGLCVYASDMCLHLPVSVDVVMLEWKTQMADGVAVRVYT